MFGRLFFCITRKVEHDNCCNQTISLKFRLLSVRVASGASVSNRKMSVMGMFRQLGLLAPTARACRAAKPVRGWVENLL